MLKLMNKVTIISVCVTIIVVIIVIFAIVFNSNKEKALPEILSESSLEKIIDISKLSTFESIYNGITEVKNEENPEEIDYYVSYESKVKVGIDFEELDILVDKDNKKIIINIPEVEITDVNVDITSLEYLFFNDDANESTISVEAYNACIEDALEECNSEAAIYDLARQNAINTVEALILPFIEDLDDGYELEIL